MRNLDAVYYAFHKNVGFTVWLTCKGAAECVSIKQHQATAPDMPDDFRNAIAFKDKNDRMAFVAEDLETAGRLARAFDHLIKLASKEDEQADPFK